MIDTGARKPEASEDTRLHLIYELLEALVPCASVVQFIEFTVNMPDDRRQVFRRSVDKANVAIDHARALLNGG